jgi:hypothetical protein
MYQKTIFIFSILFLGTITTRLVAQTSIVLPNACSTCDTDKDGVPDSVDQCPNTPLGTIVNQQGCSASSNGSSVISFSNCSAASTGTLTVSSAVSGVTQSIDVTVTSVGSYNISASANGVIFSGSGVFTTTGAQTIVLTASGTPQAVGTQTYTLNTTPNCSFTRTTNSTAPMASGDRTPCNALKNIRDFNYKYPQTLTNGTIPPMFISEEGYIYGGWGADLYSMTGLGSVYTGDVSTTYYMGSSVIKNSFPIANMVKHFPGVKFNKLLMGGESNVHMFAISEDGELYTWGGKPNIANEPISGNSNTYTNRTTAETPRKIVNPDGNLWKNMYFTSNFIYAVDNTGKWWSWGNRNNGSYTKLSFAHSPTSSAAIHYVPKAAAALVPAPKYDPAQDYTFFPHRLDSGYGVTFVYIGTDNKVYTYGAKIADETGGDVTTPQQVLLPSGVNPVKILKYGFNFFLILGDDGIIYRFGNASGYFTGSTGYTAVVHTATTYRFRDFIVGYNDLNIIGVQKTQGELIRISNNWSGGSGGYTTPSITPILGTSSFNVVKLWTDQQENVVLKDGNTGNSYVFNKVSSVGSASSWTSLAIGFEEASPTNNNSSGESLTNKGPFKLISCLDR